MIFKLMFDPSQIGSSVIHIKYVQFCQNIEGLLFFFTKWEVSIIHLKHEKRQAICTFGVKDLITCITLTFLSGILLQIFSSNLLHQSEAEMHSNRFQEYWRSIANAKYKHTIPSYENMVWEL